MAQNFLGTRGNLWMTYFLRIFKILCDVSRFFWGICGHFRELARFAYWMADGAKFPGNSREMYGWLIKILGISDCA